LIVSVAVVLPPTVGIAGFTVHPMLAEEGAHESESGMLNPSTALRISGALPDCPEGITTREVPSEKENVLRFTFTIAGALDEGL